MIKMVIREYRTRKFFKMNSKIKAGIVGIFVIALFVILSYFVQKNLSFFEEIIKDYKIWGAVFYVIILALSVVIAPVSSLPLIPLASNLYGWKIGALLNWIGWCLGAITAFSIARKWGKPLVRKLVNMKELEVLEKNLADEKKFFTLILLRMFFFPADILSYGLGLFTSISWKMLLSTTLIGILPFAIIFAYVGLLPTTFQIVFFIIGLLLLALIGYFLWRKKWMKQK